MDHLPERACRRVCSGPLGRHPAATRVDDQPGRLLDGAKWCLWHGNVHHALQRIDELIERIEHDEQIPQNPERRKFARTLKELDEYLDANRDLIPDYGDRRQRGDTISSSIAESTINQAISRRFVKKQQMRWQPETAHLPPSSQPDSQRHPA